MASTLRVALDTVDTVDFSDKHTVHAKLLARRTYLADAAKAMLDSSNMAKRGLHASEDRDFKAFETEVGKINERITEVEEVERRTALDAAANLEMGLVGEYASKVGGATVTGGATYHRGANSPSFFRDLIYAKNGSADSADRLRRNNRERGLETRALGNTGAVQGSGGEFAPPEWLVSDYVKLARPGRVTADLFNRQPLPSGVSSVNLPKVATGTTTAPQTTQNTALSQTDLTTQSLSSNIVTIGGKQVVSLQLMEQSSIPFDQVILEDLTADYARQLGTQVITGTGTAGQLRGFITPASTSVITWTTTTPTATGFYNQLSQLQGRINGARFMPPDAVVMHPRRWSWFCSYVDSSGRPLVVPTAGGFNAMADPDSTQGVGHVGSVLGMDVWTDPNIPTTLGAGTNQDIVLMMPRRDIWLWESELRAEAFTQPYSDTMGVLFRVFNYSAMIPDRYLASLGQISGTGLVTPTFAP